MKVVKVYGKLREYLGQCRFEFEAETPAQALKALHVNFPGLQQWLLSNEQDGVAYRVMVGRERITELTLERAHMPWSDREVFSIAPMICGAGGTFGRIALGVGLIAASFLFPGAGLFGATSFFGASAATTGVAGALTGIGVAVSGLGASLILGGVAQLISPTPSASSLERGREAARLESFSFSGIVNTSQQGLPVPVCYGRVYTGSAVINSGLDITQAIL